MMATLAICWVRAAHKAWAAVLLVAVVLSAGAVQLVRHELGIQTDTADMISASLPWRQRYIDFQTQFPHAFDNLLVVVDADTPDLAARAAGRLSAALAKESALFHDVQWLQGLPFFRQNALLFLDADERSAVVRDLVQAQPLLGRLHGDPSLKSVAELLDDAVANLGWVPPQTLDRFASELARAIDGALDGRFHQLSWRRFIAGTEAGAARQVMSTRPRLDYTELFPAAAATARIRALAEELGLTPARGVRIRITGGVAMSEEELRSVSVGAGRAAALALTGVALVLILGLGSVRLVLASLITLVAGLLWTAAFAAVAVGHLNMISVAFAVLYIGLGVDYAVHFALRYRELMLDGLDHARALEGAAGDVGGALTLCALTTGAGFFAFMPTSFAGVSELGLIAGVGMFVSLAATLTLMPALLTVLRPRRGAPGRLGITLPMGRAFDRLGRRHPRAVCVAALMTAMLAALLAGQARFDDNPLNLRDPAGEAVSTYRELVADGENWSLDVLVTGRDQALVLARRLEGLPGVRRVVSLESFVPRDQDAALAAIDDLTLLLGPDLSSEPGLASAPASARAALRRLATTLAALEAPSPALARLRDAVGRLHAALAVDGSGSDALLARVQASVVGALPDELSRLGDALEADTVSLESLPAPLLRDWRAPDGRWRVRVDAVGDLNDNAALVRFVEQVRTVAPEALGTPVVHLESARVVVRALIEAFALAMACIAVILMLALRSVRKVLVVMAPLVLASLVSVACLVLLEVPFNFANIIALPLLLGVGVDSGIHMLNRARMSGVQGDISGSSTARGVVTSALTTAVSFGNLAFSQHPGTASMGVLLTLGLAATLACTLLVLPALAALLLHGDAGRRSR